MKASKVRVQYAECVSQGVVVTFEDGPSVLFTSATLYQTMNDKSLPPLPEGFRCEPEFVPLAQRGG